MTELGNTATRNWISEKSFSSVRLISGLILFAYVTGHLINHSLGLISISAMESMMAVVSAFWRFPVMSIVLYGALFLHVVTALWRVFSRRSLKMSVSEWIQLLLGIAIPLLLLTHIMGTRYAFEVYGITDSYAYVLLSTFVFSPMSGWMNAAGLIATWVHGCLGLHMWAKLKPWYTTTRHEWCLAFAVLLPTLALSGYLMAGRTISPMIHDGEFMGAYYENLTLSSDAVWKWLGNDIDNARMAFIFVLLLVVAARLIRNYLRNQRNEITIDYVDGPTTKQAPGASLLEMSRLGDVPHASVCGGRGRCSTCRVRILTADPKIAPADDSERKVLARFGAESDVRLACQIYPKGSLQVMRLLPSDGTPAKEADLEPWASGREKTVTVMFADIREFTRTSESRLPFDVVYLINQFSQSMGQAVESHNGRIDKFLGDGFMALFGVDSTPEKGAADALAAAKEMVAELEKLNQRLSVELSEPMRMGIGIHTGSVILGTMGFGSARGLTAIGDTVNTASRLESATKELGCTICVSADTMRQAEFDAPKTSKKRITVRGKQEKFDVIALANAESIPAG